NETVPAPVPAEPRQSSGGRGKTKYRTYYQLAPTAPGYNKKPVFIPVAAYSITKKKPKPLSSSFGKRKMTSSSSNVITVRRKMRPVVMSEEEPDDDHGHHDPGEEDYEMRKESAVYGYLHKPEVIEFRGQYYYGGDNGHDPGYQGRPSLDYDDSSQEP